MWNIKSASYASGSRTLPPNSVVAIIGNNGEVGGRNTNAPIKVVLIETCKKACVEYIHVVSHHFGEVLLQNRYSIVYVP
mgnify:FL=1